MVKRIVQFILLVILFISSVAAQTTKLDMQTQLRQWSGNTPKDGQVAIYNASAQQWLPGDPLVSPNLPTVVQKTTNTSSGSVASLVKAYASNITSGNSLIVVCAMGNGTAPTISDTLTNTWKTAIQVANGTAFNIGVFYAVGSSAGADTITCTNGGTTASIALQIYEVSGLIQPTSTYSQQILDQTTSNTSTANTSSPSVTVMPLTPNELAITGFGLGTAAQTITVASPYNNDSGQLNPATPAGLFSMVSASNLLTSVANSSPSATVGTGEPWAVVVATFKSVIFPVSGPPLPCTMHHLLSAANTNGTVVKASAGMLYTLVITNTNANPRYVKFSDASSITVGTTAVTMTLVVPGNTTGAGMVVPVANGINFTQGISYGITAAIADNDTTAVAANEIVVNTCYK